MLRAAPCMLRQATYKLARTPLSSIRMVHAITSKDEFESAIKSGKVFVDFHATWCGPCKMIAPMLDKIEAKYPNIKFVKVDIDELSDVASKFDITAVPTLILFKDGEPTDVVKGANTQQIQAVLEKNN